MRRLSVICMAALSPALALGSIVPTGRPTVDGSGPYVWTYSLQLSADSGANSDRTRAVSPLQPADAGPGVFFTLRAFAGYVDGSCAGPEGWVCTAQGVDDDADVMDLRWAYTRGPVLGGLASGRGLGSFSAQSTYGTIGELGYATRAVTNNSGRDGSISDGEGRTFGPVVADGGITSDTTDFGQALAVNDVPEPGSLALAGLGVVMAGLARRGKGRRQDL